MVCNRKNSHKYYHLNFQHNSHGGAQQRPSITAITVRDRSKMEIGKCLKNMEEISDKIYTVSANGLRLTPSVR